MTNIELIRLALMDLGVIGENKTPSAAQGVHALTKLNQVLEDWEESGIKLGWFEQTDLSATTPLPPYAERGTISKLALALAPSYGGAASVTPYLLDDTMNGYAVIARRAALANLTPSDTSNMPRAEGHVGTNRILNG